MGITQIADIYQCNRNTVQKRAQAEGWRRDRDAMVRSHIAYHMAQEAERKLTEAEERREAEMLEALREYAQAQAEVLAAHRQDWKNLWEPLKELLAGVMGAPQQGVQQQAPSAQSGQGGTDPQDYSRQGILSRALQQQIAQARQGGAGAPAASLDDTIRRIKELSRAMKDLSEALVKAQAGERVSWGITTTVIEPKPVEERKTVAQIMTERREQGLTWNETLQIILENGHEAPLAVVKAAMKELEVGSTEEEAAMQEVAEAMQEASDEKYLERLKQLEGEAARAEQRKVEQRIARRKREQKVKYN